MTTHFSNRTEAGRQLASQLTRYANRANVLVIALPRGGVPVAFEVAKALNTPLDICLVRKLGVPGYRELAMGAIAPGGVQVLNHEVVGGLGISSQTLNRVAAQEMQELQRQDRLYRGGRPPPDVCDRTVILVDDGVATGATIRAAIAVLRQQQPQQIIVAAPVIEPETFQTLQTEVAEVVYLITPTAFCAISFWYEDFGQTTDEEVRSLLAINRLQNLPIAGSMNGYRH